MQQIAKSLLLHVLCTLETLSIAEKMVYRLEVTLNDIRSCDEAKGTYTEWLLHT